MIVLLRLKKMDQKWIGIANGVNHTLISKSFVNTALMLLHFFYDTPAV